MRESAIFKRLFSPIIFFVIAYEWLMSGLDKVLSGNFVQQLGQQLTSALHGMQYSFYVPVLKHFVIPNSVFFAVLVEIGELCVGVAFVIIAFALLGDKMNGFIAKLGFWTGLFSAFMVLNFFFFQGGAMFINPGDPFDEGIPIDFILFLMQLWIAIFFFMANRQYAFQTNKIENSEYQSESFMK